MTSAGYVFSWDDSNLWGSSHCGNIPASSYCGFQYPGDGSISYTLQGSGTAVLDFGNGYSSGTVTAYLNDTAISSAAANTPSQQVQFNFTAGDVLRVTELSTSILVINGLHCSELIWEGSDTTIPAGCSVQDSKQYYNSVEGVGNPRNNVSPICRVADPLTCFTAEVGSFNGTGCKNITLAWNSVKWLPMLL